MFWCGQPDEVMWYNTIWIHQYSHFQKESEYHAWGHCHLPVNTLTGSFGNVHQELSHKKGLVLASEHPQLHKNILQDLADWLASQSALVTSLLPQCSDTNIRPALLWSPSLPQVRIDWQCISTLYTKTFLSVSAMVDAMGECTYISSMTMAVLCTGTTRFMSKYHVWFMSKYHMWFMSKYHVWFMSKYNVSDGQNTIHYLASVYSGLHFVMNQTDKILSTI